MMTDNDIEDKETADQEGPVKSRTRIKREMNSLQKTGERLVGLSDDQIQSMEIPEDLRNAVFSAKKLKARSAKKRQLKFIGSLMRKIDIRPVSDALYEIDRGRSVRNAEFHMAEVMRDDLINGSNKTIEEVIEKYPGADRQKLRQFVRNARKELNENKPPKSSRALFKYIVNLD